MRGRMRDIELYGTSAPIIVKVINEKPEGKNKGPVVVNIKGDQLTLSGEGISEIKTTFGKTIGLPYANIIILKNNAFKVAEGEKKTDQVLLNITTVENRVNGYQGVLSVILVNKDATVIKLAMNSATPEKTKKILDKLVEVYNRDAIDDKTSESKKTAQFIDGRIEIIGNELGMVENQKERFKEANQITDLETEAKIGLQSSSEARVKQIEVDSQLELTDALIGFVAKQGSYQVLPSNIGLDNPGAVSNIMGYNQLVLERNRLLENATPQNPLVVDITKQINNIRTSVVESLAKNRSGLQIAKNNYLSEQNKLGGRISKIPAQEKLFRGIERQQQIKESLYLLLLQKREETAVSLAVTAPKARIVDLAYVSPAPIAPKGKIILFGGMVLGFMIPLAFVYLLELFDNKIRSKHDIEKLSVYPIMGEIPSLEKGQSEVVLQNDLSPMAEAFRILITNMNFMLPKKDKGKVIFVTSTIKGEGKTFVSVNLVLTLASPKHKVVVIGADIRNPQLQRYNPSSRGLDGLTEYLYNEGEKIDDIIHVSSFNPYCDIIYSGSIPPNPTDLLSNGRYEQLINELKLRYEYIIVDTAPLMLVTDTFLTSELADATLYVTRSQYTEKSLLDFANRSIASKKIKNAGFVLNDVENDYLGYGNKYVYGYNNIEKGFFARLKDKLRL
jgi:tyrosine-protein kinase Etk/Wzc